jgi:hypothetical protein
MGASARERLSARSVGQALARVHVEPAAMIAALWSPHAETRRWPAMTIVARVRRPRSEACVRELRVCAASTELRAPLASAVDDLGLWHTHTAIVRSWLSSTG